MIAVVSLIIACVLAVGLLLLGLATWGNRKQLRAMRAHLAIHEEADHVV